MSASEACISNGLVRWCRDTRGACCTGGDCTIGTNVITHGYNEVPPESNKPTDSD